jgi:DNA-binding NarL/FixJ family response regulator
LLDDQTHVITDLLLKDGTTIELLLAIRKHPHPPRVAVVTASDREAQVVRQAAALEPDVMLQKPVDANALLDWLAADPA